MKPFLEEYVKLGPGEEVADGVIQQTLAHEIHALESLEVSVRTQWLCQIWVPVNIDNSRRPKAQVIILRTTLPSNPGLTHTTSITAPASPAVRLGTWRIPAKR